MSQPIDITYVELRARGEDDAAREVKKAVDEMQRDVDRSSREMEADVARAFDGIEKEIRDAQKEVRRLAAEFGNTGDRAILPQVKKAQSFVRELLNVQKALTGASDAAGGGGDSLFARLAQVGSQLRGISALTPPPILLGLAAAIPAILALGGALLDLSGVLLALPAAVAVAGAGFATLKVAFSGFGDAVSALASGDLDKINEAMKNLAPAAQTVAREINKLREPFRALRKEVQQSFFAPLQGDLTRLANAVLPTLRSGMRGVAAAFGDLGSAVLDLLSQNDIVEGLGDIFESTARIVRNVTPELVDFLGTLFGVIEHGLPFVERAFDKLGDGLDALNGFLSGSLKSGDFEKFLEDAFATMGDLFDLTKAVFGLLKAVFGDTGDEGRTFIQTLTDLTNQMTAFFESAEGQEILQKLVDLLPIMTDALKAGLTIFGLLVLAQNGWLNALRDLGAAIVVAGKAIGDFFQAAWDWVQRAGKAIGDFFVATGQFFSDLGGKIKDAFTAVVGFGGQIVDFVVALPGRILEAIQALPGTLGRIFTDALNAAAYAIGFGIGTIVKFFTDLPGRLATGLQRIVDLTVSTFTTARDRSIEFVLQLINTVTTFINELPGKITAGLTALRDRVSSFFSQTRDAGRNRISELISAVGGFFSSLPERVTGALNSFKTRVLNIFNSIKNSAYNIGRDIINGIKNGIVDAIGGAVALARNAAARIVKGFKDALKTGSPSRVTENEIGRPIAQGIGVGIEAEEPGLKDRINRMVANAVPSLGVAPGVGAPSGAGSGTTIAFEPGAVQVMFEGAVPTEDEARRTGTVVGESIARTLVRRDVRTLVRTT